MQLNFRQFGMERMVESVYCIVVCRVTLAGLKGDVNFRVQQIDCCGWFHMIPLDQGQISGFLSLSEEMLEFQVLGRRGPFTVYIY
jgi:hypothetical protein